MGRAGFFDEVDLPSAERAELENPFSWNDSSLPVPRVQDFFDDVDGSSLPRYPSSSSSPLADLEARLVPSSVVADDKDVAQVDDTIQERKIRMPRRFRPKK
jgi:hypothetical protein